MLSHTVVEIHGKERVCGVTIAKVDASRKPIAETRQFIECDTLLLSCGLIPENELTKCAGISLDRVTNGATVDQDRQTEVEGIFACGNVLHVHDLVDYVSEEAEIAGYAAAEYIKGKNDDSVNISLVTDGKIRYTVPQRISAKKNVTVYFRVSDVFRNVRIVVKNGDKILINKKKQKVAPGEMETVMLKADMLSDISDKLTFSLEFDERTAE
jgi:pyruvate/2-oxoglutarate dehydrogenase complex dihydrolipoamide dehydrogenase (E3) component